VSTNTPIVDRNPERKELKGKVPTSAQYRNWMTLVSST
jgi:hypothetical protein